MLLPICQIDRCRLSHKQTLHIFCSLLPLYQAKTENIYYSISISYMSSKRYITSGGIGTPLNYASSVSKNSTSGPSSMQGGNGEHVLFLDWHTSRLQTEENSKSGSFMITRDLILMSFSSFSLIAGTQIFLEEEVRMRVSRRRKRSLFMLYVIQIMKI